MKTKYSFLLWIIASVCAVPAQAEVLEEAVISAGAARLDNGSIVIIGQPFVGVMVVGNNSVVLHVGLIPVLGGTSIREPVLQPPTRTPTNPVPGAVVLANAAYSGLIYDTNGITHESSGYFSATVSDKGKFSAKLQLGGDNYSVSGSFDTLGNARKTVELPGAKPLQISLQLVPSDPGYMLGTVSSEGWIAEIFANKAVFDAANPCANAGSYTLAIAGEQGDDFNPGGYGYGTLTVDKQGGLKFAGSLADGTPVSQSATLSKAGEWPLYVPLYGGRGSLISWISFADQPENDLTGVLSWTKPHSGTGKYDSDGFTNEVMVIGSKYAQAATGAGVMGWVNGLVDFSGNNLAEGITNSIAFTDSDKALNTGNIKMSLTLVPRNGSFKGVWEAPGSAKSVPFQGILFQKVNTGYGYFLGTNLSGSVQLAPIAH